MEPADDLNSSIRYCDLLYLSLSKSRDFNLETKLKVHGLAFLEFTGHLSKEEERSMSLAFAPCRLHVEVSCSNFRLLFTFRKERQG